MTWAADIDAKVDGLFASIDRSGDRRDRGAGASAQARVPRPPRPLQPGKIDISNAPSEMEERARRWGGQ